MSTPSPRLMVESTASLSNVYLRGTLPFAAAVLAAFAVVGVVIGKPDMVAFAVFMPVLFYPALLVARKVIKPKLYQPGVSLRKERKLPSAPEPVSPEVVAALLGAGLVSPADKVYGTACNVRRLDAAARPGTWCFALTDEALVGLLRTRSRKWVRIRFPYAGLTKIHASFKHVIVGDGGRTASFMVAGAAWRARKDFNARLLALIDAARTGHALPAAMHSLAVKCGTTAIENAAFAVSLDSNRRVVNPMLELTWWQAFLMGLTAAIGAEVGP